MSRIASVKETGEEVSQADWTRFEQAVQAEVDRRPEAEPRHASKRQDAPAPAQVGQKVR